MAAATGKNANTDNSTTSLEDDVRQLQKDIKKLTELLTQTKDHSYSAASKAASEGIEQLRAQGDAAMDSIRKSAEDFESQICNSVREKPVTSLALAAGAGFLLALLSRR